MKQRMMCLIAFILCLFLLPSGCVPVVVRAMGQDTDSEEGGVAVQPVVTTGSNGQTTPDEENVTTPAIQTTPDVPPLSNEEITAPPDEEIAATSDGEIAATPVVQDTPDVPPLPDAEITATPDVQTTPPGGESSSSPDALPTPTAAPSATGSVKVTVLSAAGRTPIANAQVKLLAENRVMDSKQTNTHGVAVFEQAPLSGCILRVSAKGYATASIKGGSVCTIVLDTVSETDGAAGEADLAEGDTPPAQHSPDAWTTAQLTPAIEATPDVGDGTHLKEQEPDAPSTTAASGEQSTQPDESETPQTTPDDLVPPLSADELLAKMIEIHAEDTTVAVGDSSFQLLFGVSATERSGASVRVWVSDDGGFDVMTAGAYTVEYAAMQGSDEISKTRIVTVVDADPADSMEESETLDEAAPQIDPTSAIYLRRLRQRESLHSSLTASIETLNGRIAEQAEQLASSGRHLWFLSTDRSVKGSAAGLQVEQYRQIDTPKLDDWGNIMAVYSVLSGISIEQPIDLLNLQPDDLTCLDDAFEAMVRLNVLRTSGDTSVLIDVASIEDAAEQLEFSAEQLALAKRLTGADYRKVFAALTDGVSYSAMTQAEAEQTLTELPKGLSNERKAVVMTARSLIGQIHYVWGGKYNQIGSKPSWFLAENSESGLDCSGFVSWAFINAFGSEEMIEQIGNGSSSQWARSTAVDWNDAKPGDLMFIAVPGTRKVNHVGIVASIEPDGTILVIHCASSRHGVIVTEAWDSGFRYVRRPSVWSAGN